MLNNYKIAGAANASSKEQEPILVDVFRIEVNAEKGYYIWISTYAEQGEERGASVHFYEDIYDFAYYRMNHSGHFKVNIYDVEYIDYLNVPYQELNGIISNVNMGGRTKFVETRNIKVEATETTEGTDVKITVLDVNSTTNKKWIIKHWKTLGTTNAISR